MSGKRLPGCLDTIVLTNAVPRGLNEVWYSNYMKGETDLAMRTSIVLLLALLFALSTAVPSAATSAGICLSRDPAPPGVVYNDGTGIITFEYTVSYLTHPMPPGSLILNAVPFSGPSIQLFSSNNTPTSPWGGSFPWTVPAGTTAGYYYGKLDFYSDWTGSRAMEDEAQVGFIIAGAGRFKISKFNDWDGDGKWDKKSLGDAYDEPPIANWEFHIERPAGTLVKSVTTGANGYTADITLPMVPFDATSTTYFIKEVMPAGWERTKPTAEPYQLSLTPGPMASAVEYGNWQPGRLNITKFYDADGDGTKDTGEVGLPGWTFQVERPLGTIVKTLTTGSNGDTGEVKLPVDPAASPTRYWIREMPQGTGWRQTTPADNPHAVDLSPGALTTQLFGNWRPATFRIYKFNDSDADSDLDPNEPPLPGWEFNVTAPNGAVTTLKTGANGYTPYLTGPVGTYTIQEVLQPGWQKTTQNGQNPFTVIGAENSNFEVLVGNFMPVTICGEVRLDNCPWPWTKTHWVGTNPLQQNSPEWEPGPGKDPPAVTGIEGVPVELWANNLKLKSCVTGVNGEFSFSGVPYQRYFTIKTVKHSDDPPDCDPDVPHAAHCSRDDWPGVYIGTVAMSKKALDFDSPYDLDLDLDAPTAPNPEYCSNFFYQRHPSRIWGIVHGPSGEPLQPSVDITVDKWTSAGPNTAGAWAPWLSTPKSCSSCGFYEVAVIGGTEPEGIRQGCTGVNCKYRLTIGPPSSADQSWTAKVSCHGPHSEEQIIQNSVGAGSVSVEVDVDPGTDVRVDFFLSADNLRRCNLPVTLTQQDWHNLSDPNTPGISGGMLYSKFAVAFKNFTFYNIAYPNTIIAGKQHTITFGGATNSLTRLSNFFPQNGAPGKLTTNYIEPGTTSAGVLAGEVLALTMNIAYNDTRVMPRSPGFDLEGFVINYGIFKQRSVGQVLDIAERVLGGDPPAWYGLPDYDSLVQVLQAINANYQMSDINSFHDRGYLTPTNNTPHTPPHDPHVP